MERLSWTLKKDRVFLYRVEEGKAFAEAELKMAYSGEVRLSTFILDTPFFQFGSFSPAGLWAFGDMMNLAGPEDLHKGKALKLSRGTLGMEHFAASLSWPDRGGTFYLQRKTYHQAGLWGKLDFLSYGRLSFGGNLHLPKIEKSREEWFFKKKASPSKAFGQGLLAGSYDFRDIRAGCQAGFSGSPYLIPGFSILPSLLWTVSHWKVHSRFWYASPSWRSSRGAKPPWRWDWNSTAAYYYSMGWIRMVYSERRSVSGAGQREGKITAQVDIGDFQLGISSRLENKPGLYSDGYNTDSGYKGKIRWSRGGFRLQLDGSFLLRGKEPREWFTGVSGQYRVFRNSRITGGCKTKGEPGFIKIAPEVKMFFSFGNFLLKGFWKYDIYYPERPLTSGFPLHLGFSVQWNQSGKSFGE